MIYLFDDNTERRNVFLNKGIDLSSLKYDLVFDCDKASMPSFVDNNMQDAKVVIFHKSYLFPQKQITIEDIESYFISKKIHFIRFSGSSSTAMYKDNDLQHAEMSSETMYQNLPVFLKKVSEGEMSVPILVYGLKYLKNVLMCLQNEIVSYLFDKSDQLTEDDIYVIEDIMSSYLSKFNEFGEDKVKIKDWLENKIEKGELPIVGTIINLFERLLDRY